MVNTKNYLKAVEYYDAIINNYPNSPEYSEAVIKKSKIYPIISSKPSHQKKVDQTKQLEIPKLQEKPKEAQDSPRKNIEDIENSLKKIITSSSKDTSSRAKYELAMLYKSQGKYNEALKLLQEITDEVFNETSAMAQFEIGEILSINGDYNRAWKEYIKVIYIYKDYKDIVVKSMYYTILCYIKIKAYDQAQKMYQKMVKEFYGNTWTEEARKLLGK